MAKSFVAEFGANGRPRYKAERSSLRDSKHSRASLRVRRNKVAAMVLFKQVLPFLVALGLVFSAVRYFGSAPRNVPHGWYYAGSNLEDATACGGFGPCNNFPKKIENDALGKPGEVSLIVEPNTIVDFGKRKAIVLKLVNRTAETTSFAACDSGLYIVQEALNRRGEWQPLERFPDSFCGNSFHQVFLEPDEYWAFYAIPRVGGFKTKLRFRLERLGERANGAGIIVSDEYEGSVSPTAFVRSPIGEQHR